MTDWSLLFHDDFNRADTAAGGVGNGWVDPQTHFFIEAGRLKHPPDGNFRWHLHRPVESDRLIQRGIVQLPSPFPVRGSFALRRQDGDNCYLIGVQDDNYEIYALSDSVGVTQIMQTGIPNYSTSKTYELECVVTGSDPTTLRLILHEDGVGQIVDDSVTDSTPELQQAGGYALSAWSDNVGDGYGPVWFYEEATDQTPAPTGLTRPMVEPISALISQSLG